MSSEAKAIARKAVAKQRREEAVFEKTINKMAIENIVVDASKPILLRPSLELRKRLEFEAAQANRSLNNLLVVILTNYFIAKDEDLEVRK